MGQALLAMEPGEMIRFQDIRAEEYENQECILEFELDMPLLSPWAMYYTGEGSPDQRGYIDRDSFVDEFEEFWFMRIDGFAIPSRCVAISGRAWDFNGNKLEQECEWIPIKMLFRATNDTIEKRGREDLQLHRVRVAHDLMIAVADDDRRYAFYSDDSAGNPDFPLD